MTLEVLANGAPLVVGGVGDYRWLLPSLLALSPCCYRKFWVLLVSTSDASDTLFVKERGREIKEKRGYKNYGVETMKQRWYKVKGGTRKKDEVQTR